MKERAKFLSALGLECSVHKPASPPRALTFAASGPQGRSGACSPAHTAPSATRGQTGTAPRSRPWRSLWAHKQEAPSRSWSEWRQTERTALVIKSHQGLPTPSLWILHGTNRAERRPGCVWSVYRTEYLLGTFTPPPTSTSSKTLLI